MPWLGPALYIQKVSPCLGPLWGGAFRCCSLPFSREGGLWKCGCISCCVPWYVPFTLAFCKPPVFGHVRPFLVLPILFIHSALSCLPSTRWWGQWLAHQVHAELDQVKEDFTKEVVPEPSLPELARICVFQEGALPALSLNPHNNLLM